MAKQSVYNLQGSLVAIVTPFTQSGELDMGAYKRLLQEHLRAKTDGIVVCGTTGEAEALSSDEQRQMIEFTVAETHGKVPVIAGATAASTAETIHKAKLCKEAGADAILVAAPPYVKPSDTGLYEHYKAVVEATHMPLVVYNIVGRTAKNVPTPILMKLANEFKEVFAVKEASADMNQIMDVLDQRPKGFRVYSGEDHLAAAMTLMGGDGCIAVLANEIPVDFRRMIHAALAGRRDEAMRLHFKYLDLMRANFFEGNPIPVKTALALAGKITETFRLPMTKMSPEPKQRLTAVLKKHKLTK